MVNLDKDFIVKPPRNAQIYLVISKVGPALDKVRESQNKPCMLPSQVPKLLIVHLLLCLSSRRSLLDQREASGETQEQRFAKSIGSRQRAFDLHARAANALLHQDKCGIVKPFLPSGISILI